MTMAPRGRINAQVVALLVSGVLAFYTALLTVLLLISSVGQPLNLSAVTGNDAEADIRFLATFQALYLSPIVPCLEPEQKLVAALIIMSVSLLILSVRMAAAVVRTRSD